MTINIANTCTNVIIKNDKSIECVYRVPCHQRLALYLHILVQVLYFLFELLQVEGNHPKRRKQREIGVQECESECVNGHDHDNR